MFLKYHRKKEELGDKNSTIEKKQKNKMLKGKKNCEVELRSRRRAIS